MNKKILRLTIPNIITNITVPLLGMVDLAIIGSMGDVNALAAIAVGAALFNLIYWNFGFLRMSSSGLAAIAYGRRDFEECTSVLLRGVGVAIAIGIVIIVLKSVIAPLTISIMGSEGAEVSLVEGYFFARVWAAPAALSMYVFKGWFIGMQNPRTPMYIAIAMNIVNIVMSLLFVKVWGFGIEGVAWGTVLAQYSAVLASLYILAWKYGRLRKYVNIKKVVAIKQIKNFFRVNVNVFLRTVCLVAVFTFFTAASRSMGREIVAANNLLMQLFILFSYIMDGFAYSGEALVGRYWGAGNRAMLRSAVRHLVGWGVGIAALFTVIYILFLEPILRVFTKIDSVIATAETFRWWIVAVPFAGFLAFLYDGILVGVMASKIMRNVMFIATALFFCSYYLLKSSLGVDALWLSFILYLFLRGVGQALMCKKSLRSTFR